MNKRQKINSLQVVSMALYLLLGAWIGFQLADLPLGDGSLMQQIAAVAGCILCLYLAIYLQLIIHEAGHLLFGLLTGYRFSSFRIGSTIWLRLNGKIVRRRYSLAGTGGQCLMCPPDMADGSMPFALYNLGGVILNAASGLLFLALYLRFPQSGLLSLTFQILAAFGLVLALTNGLPLHGVMDNDGRNVLSLRRNPEALRAFWIQLKVNDLQREGVRLRHMPEEWFTATPNADRSNTLITAIQVFACNRLLDAHDFQEAELRMHQLLESDATVELLHRALLTCDSAYCAMIAHHPQKEIAAMLDDKQQKKIMKVMSRFPSVLRTQYARALLVDQNAEEAEKILARFEVCAKTYPYAAEIESERELIQIAMEAKSHENTNCPD